MGMTIQQAQDHVRRAAANRRGQKGAGHWGNRGAMALATRPDAFSPAARGGRCPPARQTFPQEPCGVIDECLSPGAIQLASAAVVASRFIKAENADEMFGVNSTAPIAALAIATLVGEPQRDMWVHRFVVPDDVTQQNFLIKSITIGAYLALSSDAGIHAATFKPDQTGQNIIVNQVVTAGTKVVVEVQNLDAVNPHDAFTSFFGSPPA